MVLVLVDPALSLLRLCHELVVPKASIDKAVDKAACEVLLCRVDGDGSDARARVFEMRLVDILERARLNQVELLAEQLKVLAKLGVAENVEQALIGRFLICAVELLASENEGELPAHGSGRDECDRQCQSGCDDGICHSCESWNTYGFFGALKSSLMSSWSPKRKLHTMACEYFSNLR